MGNPVVHFEIGCRDSAKTRSFYAKLFGWKFEQTGPAAMINTGGAVTGHITALGHEPQSLHHLLCRSRQCAALSRQCAIARRKNACAARRYSPWDFCLDAGSRRKHGRSVEKEVSLPNTP